VGVTASIQIISKATDTRTVGLESTAVKVVDESWAIAFTDGTGANQVQKIYAVEHTIAGTEDDLDLVGVLTDAFGSTLSLAEIKAWGVQAASTNGGNVVVGTAAPANPWTTCLSGTVTLHPGAVAVFATPNATGWAAVGGASDAIRLAGANGYKARIFFLGNP
jgi:hypothetical protein